VRPATIQRVCRALAREYRNPRLGNKSNPLDELVFIILSTRTQDQAFRATFSKLRAQFPSWSSVDRRDRTRIERILRPAGLGRLKAGQLLAVFERLRSSYGRATLAPLRRLPNRQAEAFLTSLPGVASKVAKCVLMYSLGRQVLPVDVHVHRVATRLGLETKKRPDTSQDLIEGAIPPRLRYGFHVNAVAHGRSVCLPRAPRCDICCIATWCRYDRTRERRRFHDREP
jgi:endonuclease III